MAWQNEPHELVTEKASDKFEDFDLPNVFKRTEAAAASKTAQNFVVEFGANHARIAHDLGEGHIRELLDDTGNPRGKNYPVRWINIWDSSAQKEIVKIVGEKYNLSHRLISLMMYAAEFNVAAKLRGEKRAATSTSFSTSRREQQDVEKGSTGDSEKKSFEAGTGLPQLEGEEIELYFLLKDSVNFTSIDPTEKALCIGAHWLHRRPQIGQVESDRHLLPPKHWLWLAICNDNTVLSFHEQATLEPVPKDFTKDENEWCETQIRSIRSNTVNVLLQQSSCGFKMFEQKPLSQASVRQSLSPNPGMKFMASDIAMFNNGLSGTMGEEGASNLFYYLFEDYAAAGPLKAAGRILEDLTPKVLTSANRNNKTKSSDVIPKLHNLSKELRKLKHLFENYKILIDKIMVTTKPDPSKHHRHSIVNRPKASISDISKDNNACDGDRVILTKSAINRFERLRNRLQGLMLNTIQGNLEEITALSDTYFNLTQQKDSQAVARLTRSATLLTKLSVFFLPISFMTSYFSVQITDLTDHWTAKTYWYPFAVIASVSFVSLFFFSRLLMFFSDVLDEWAAKIAIGSRRLVVMIGIPIKTAEDDDDV